MFSKNKRFSMISSSFSCLMIVKLNEFDRASASSLNVVAGEHDLSSVSNNEQVVNVKRINIHPHYDVSISDNDIAILEVRC